MSFLNYRLQNTYLFKCLKSHVSVHPRKVNILNGPKHCCIMHDNSFISLVNHSGKISVGESVSW